MTVDSAIKKILFTMVGIVLFQSCKSFPKPLPDDFRLRVYHGGGMRPGGTEFIWTSKGLEYHEDSYNSKIFFVIPANMADTLQSILSKYSFASLTTKKSKSIKHDYPTSSISLDCPSAKYRKEVMTSAGHQPPIHQMERFGNLYNALQDLAYSYRESQVRTIVINWSPEITSEVDQLYFNKDNWFLKSEKSINVEIIPGYYKLILNAPPDDKGIVNNLSTIEVEIKQDHKEIYIYKDVNGAFRAEVK